MNNTIPYVIIRSPRQSISIEITPDNQVIIRCPRQVTDEEVQAFVRKKQDWLNARLATRSHTLQKPALTREQLEELTQRAMDYLPGRVQFWSQRLGIPYGRITVRHQKTRWGSCSSNGNLNFNCVLMLTNPQVVDYVVVHELCHRLEMNHSPRFWSRVKEAMPDYLEYRQWLKNNGPAIIRRIPG